jgi:hypothetical protein
LELRQNTLVQQGERIPARRKPSHHHAVFGRIVCCRDPIAHSTHPVLAPVTQQRSNSQINVGSQAAVERYLAFTIGVSLRSGCKVDEAEIHRLAELVHALLCEEDVREVGLDPPYPPIRTRVGRVSSRLREIRHHPRSE